MNLKCVVSYTMLRYWGHSKCSGNTFDWFMRLHILQDTYSWPHLGPFSILPQTIKQGWWMGVAPLHMQTFTYLAAGPEQENSPSLNHLFVAYPALCGFVSDLEWVSGWSRSVVSNSATPWIVACQAPPSMGFSRQEYWSGLPFPSPGDLPIPGIEPRSPTL